MKTDKKLIVLCLNDFPVGIYTSLTKAESAKIGSVLIWILRFARKLQPLIILGIALSTPPSYGIPAVIKVHSEFPFERENPSLVKDVFIHNETLEVDGSLSLSNALYSRVATAPQREINNPVLLRKDHSGIVEFFIGEQCFEKNHGQPIIFSTLGFVSFPYPTS